MPDGTLAVFFTGDWLLGEDLPPLQPVLDALEASSMPPAAAIDASAVGDWDTGLVVALMPGWNRAELRELTNVGGRHYLKATNPDLPDRLIPVSVQNNREAYLDVTQRPSDGIAPALILGRVILRAQPES